jgi:DNA polymerase-1
MSPSNLRIDLLVRDPQCTMCKMHAQANGPDRCRVVEGDHQAKVLVVSKTPLGARSRKELHTYLERAGFDPEELAYTGAIKCLVFDLTANKTDLKTCKSYLDKEIEAIKPTWILALGNEALTSTAGKSGIMKHRGKLYTRKDGVKVMATISPAAVYRNPGQKGGFEADLKYFYNAVNGITTEKGVEPDQFQYHPVMNKEVLLQFIDHLENADIASIDIESTGFDEFAADARIVSLAVTIRWQREDASETYEDVYALPLYHPQSPWRSSWQKVLGIVAPYMNAVRKRIAHNGKFDCRWLHQFGCETYLTFDTMLAAAMLDENRPKGLKPLAQQLLGAPPWAIDTKDLLNEPLEDVLWYNALDTWHTLHIYDQIRGELLKQKRLTKMFQHIIMPASNTLVNVERHGVFTDAPKLRKHWAIAQRELDGVDQRLMEWVPEEHPFQQTKRRRGGNVEHLENVNWNPSNFLRWFVFDHLDLPVLERGKEKDNGDPGDPSLREAVLLELKENPGHDVIDLLLERTKWQKYTSAFFSSYAEQLDANSRIHTTFKLAGTVTGRLSSGKADEDKVTAKKQIRGVNLQQVPRDAFVRGIFGSAPGNYFVEFDYSQVELRIAAFIAQEPTMLHLYATGQDIHTTMAMRMTGKPWHGGHCDCGGCVTKEERKKAKAVNFGFLYGMGWFKFISTAWENYGVRVTEEESRAFRKSFFDQFPKLPRWHAMQRKMAHDLGYVTSPMGRIRHLPDIHSRTQAVVAEAERQAINSPVQAMASDMALWSMVLVDRKFKEMGLTATPIGTVHDAINYEVPREELGVALPIIKHTMENLPLERVFGVDLNVPVIADCKVGTRWGGATEVDAADVMNWNDDLLEKIA